MSATQSRGTGRAAAGGVAPGGAQSFVGTLSACFKQPSLLAIEVAWRWLFGVPALAVGYVQAHRVLMEATGGTLDPGRLGLDKALLNDPVGALSADPLLASARIFGALQAVLPGLEHVAVWLLPALLAAWIVLSSVGRTLLLRRADAAVTPRVGTLMLLSMVRVLALAGIFALWWQVISWSGRTAVVNPATAGQEPNLILYCALVIVSSLGLFTLWAFLSWFFSLAPMLAVLQNLGPAESLAASARIPRQLRTRLVEINLVMGIVKIALVVLAMVFSATPLPFQSVTTPTFLLCWWAGVTLLYLLWSDFFQVVRVVAYLRLWRSGDRTAEAAPAI